MGTVVSKTTLSGIRTTLRDARKKVVFTNGCFDLVHRGHVEYLTKAKSMGDVLIVGVNTDRSVRVLKGPLRPIVEEEDRAAVVASLAPVDYVCLFDEDTPLELIRLLVPDVLVKGADWPIEAVVGREIVERAGGVVKTIEYLSNRSTSQIIEKIVRAASRKP
ncbi:MAG: D-glycero-beta-D-manno-heptose 1-phosphate adenylyltransferase [Bacteroidota bacterium]